jgi:hypothetical protein
MRFSVLTTIQTIRFATATGRARKTKVAVVPGIAVY